MAVELSLTKKTFLQTILNNNNNNDKVVSALPISIALRNTFNTFPSNGILCTYNTIQTTQLGNNNNNSTHQ